MSKAKFAEPILQTIDQLRSHKARPDLSRICHMVERRHGLSADDVETNLAIMVAENRVLKVNYKGNISYRNPAKWKRCKRDHSETADRKSAAIIRAKLPKKKLLKLKATKALVKPKRKRGRPPLKKKAKVKIVAEADEDTEEEVIDESMMATAVVDDDDINNDVSKSPEVDSHRQDKSDNESAPDSSADENSGVGRQKVCIKYQLVKGRKKYELVKRKSSCGGKGGSSINRQKTGGTESDCTTCENESLNDVITDDVKDTKAEPASSPVSSKKIKLIVNKKKKTKRNIFQDLQLYLPVKKACHEVNKKDDVKMNFLASEVKSQDPKCDYCLQTASSNQNGQPEELLVCKDCQAKAHPSCMDYSDVLARRACQSPWQCIDCKMCNICNGSGDADSMLFCDACDKGYHMNCHQPPINEKPKGKWVCCRCVVELGGDGDQTGCGENDQEINGDQALEENLNPADSGGASCLPTPNDSPVHFSEDVDESKMSSKLSPSIVVPIPRLAATLTAEVPDASSWSIVDVVKFFSDMGFTEQSEAFKEQEIDGRALLLMTRMDVLTGLSLKLGPALKIYVHVQRLQAKHLNSH